MASPGGRSDRPASAGGVQVIARAAQILRALDGEPDGLSLARLSERLGLPRSTVHRVVSALAAEGLVAAASPRGFPLHCTANGKAILAALGPEEGARVLPARLERRTPATITGRAELMAELETVRETRVAFDREEHTTGISAAGIAVRDPFGALAAVSVPVPTQRFAGREAEIAAGLVAARTDIRRALGLPDE